MGGGAEPSTKRVGGMPSIFGSFGAGSTVPIDHIETFVSIGPAPTNHEHLSSISFSNVHG